MNTAIKALKFYCIGTSVAGTVIGSLAGLSIGFDVSYNKLLIFIVGGAVVGAGAGPMMVPFMIFFHKKLNHTP